MQHGLGIPLTLCCGCCWAAVLAVPQADGKSLPRGLAS